MDADLRIVAGFGLVREISLELGCDDGDVYVIVPQVLRTAKQSAQNFPSRSAPSFSLTCIKLCVVLLTPLTGPSDSVARRIFLPLSFSGNSIAGALEVGASKAGVGFSGAMRVNDSTRGKRLARKRRLGNR